MRLFIILSICLVLPALAFATDPEPVFVVAGELIFQQFLMGLAGVVSAGLFWSGIYRLI